MTRSRGNTTRATACRSCIPKPTTCRVREGAKPSLELGRFSAASRDWWQHADLTVHGVQWGGETAAALLDGYPAKADVRGKLEHIWSRYVDWGLAHPDKYKVMAQLRMSDKLTEETRAIGYEPFAEVEAMIRETGRTPRRRTTLYGVPERSYPAG